MTNIVTNVISTTYIFLRQTPRNEMIGTIQLGSRTPKKSTPEEIRLLETIGHQLGIAVQKINLFEDTTKRADDLTLKAMELEKANRAKDEFLAMISHELRTPLNVMMGYTGLLQEGMFGALNPQQDDALKKVAVQSNDLLNIVMNLLRATQIGSGEIKAEWARTDLGQLLDEIKNGYDLPKKNELTLNWDFPSDLPIVETDSEKLRHILVNLIDNAIKFTEKGSVRITAHHLPKSNTLRFTVADSGPGIPQELLPNIFDMFHQVDGSDTRAHGGLGLGLYLVKNFVELLGGKIKVRSAPGRGVCVYGYIPLRIQSVPRNHSARRRGHDELSCPCHCMQCSCSLGSHFVESCFA